MTIESRWGPPLSTYFRSFETCFSGLRIPLRLGLPRPEEVGVRERRALSVFVIFLWGGVSVRRLFSGGWDDAGAVEGLCLCVINSDMRRMAHGDGWGYGNECVNG